MPDRVNHEQHLGFLLATLGRLTERRWTAFLRERGTTTAEFTAMAVLADPAAGPPSQGELAARMAIDPRNAGATVARLRRRGWVHSAVAPDDARVRLLEVTPEGRRWWAELQRDLAAVRGEQLRGLTAAEVRELERLLRKLRDGMT